MRGGGFYPSALYKGGRTEQALNIALAEMYYVQGVSTRKVITVLQALLGPEVSISSTQVSRAAEQLDAGLAVWRERPLDGTPYVFLDARYERVREGGQLVDCAALVAVGITRSGHPGCWVSRSPCPRRKSIGGLSSTAWYDGDSRASK